MKQTLNWLDMKNNRSWYLNGIDDSLLCEPLEQNARKEVTKLRQLMLTHKQKKLKQVNT